MTTDREITLALANEVYDILINEISGATGIPPNILNESSFLTELEQADLDLRKYISANAAAMYATWEEVRQQLNLPPFIEYFHNRPNGISECMHLYGMTPEELDNIQFKR